MNANNAQDDLAFLRGLVQAGDDGQRQFGETYLAAGLCYGVQMLLHGTQLMGWPWAQGGAYGLLIGLGPTVVFLCLLLVIARRHRTRPRDSVAGRAVGAVFGGVGLANLALIAVIGAAALRQQSVEVWLIYPCVVMVLQGMAWMAVWMIRRKAWFAAVSAGWFAAGVASGFAIGHSTAFVAILGVAFVMLMVVPGAAMIRQSQPRV